MAREVLKNELGIKLEKDGDMYYLSVDDIPTLAIGEDFKDLIFKSYNHSVEVRRRHN